MRDEPTLPMTGRTVLITGGTGGIGKATALRLTGTGPSVSIIGRDPGRTATTAHEIHAQAGAGQHVHAFTADLSSQSEVRRVAAEVLAALPRIEVLINNVGGYWNTRHTSVDGIEHTFAVSHMAPYLLTNLLVERLVATGSARIVNVASNAQALGRLDFDDLQGERGYSGARAYHQSKLANVLFTYELARRLATRRVRATPCTREWSVPDSERRIPDAAHGFSSR
jgi:retinol dehydrogenase-14